VGVRKGCLLGVVDSVGELSEVFGLHVEYAERRLKYGILFTFNPFYEYSNLEYEDVPV